MGLKQAATRAGFLASPVGRFVRGRAWAFCCPHPGLYVTLLAGRLDEGDVRELTGVYAVRGARRTPHVKLFDASRVQTIDAAALGLLLDFYVARTAALTRNCSKVAVVHGGGATGAVFAGYPKLLPLECEQRSFGDTDAALAWLGADEAVRRELVTLAESLGGDDVHLARLRALLGERVDLSLAGAARTLGLAARSLQRRLADGGTSFQRELDRARLEAATRRLGDARRPLTSIALDLGFSSLRSFTDWFRAQTGAPPRAWRDRAKSVKAR